jgi:hypothetical protein
VELFHLPPPSENGKYKDDIVLDLSSILYAGNEPELGKQLRKVYGVFGFEPEPVNLK